MPNGWFKHVKTPGLNCLAHLDNCVKIAVAHTEVLETRGIDLLPLHRVARATFCASLCQPFWLRSASSHLPHLHGDVQASIGLRVPANLDHVEIWCSCIFASWWKIIGRVTYPWYKSYVRSFLASRTTVSDLLPRSKAWSREVTKRPIGFLFWDGEPRPRSWEWLVVTGKGFLFATHLAYWNGCGSKCKVWIKPWSHKRSRPLIQTCPRELIQNFDPHLWNDLMYERVDVWSSGGCMFLGFLLLFTLPSSQATNCCKATLPSI